MLVLHILIVEHGDSENSPLIARFHHVDSAQVRLYHVPDLGAASVSVHQLEPDIILINPDLPGISYESAVLTLKQFKPQVPFVVVTDEYSEALEQQVISLGGQDYLSLAEAEPARLMRSLRMAVQRHRQAGHQADRSLVQAVHAAAVMLNSSLKLEEVLERVLEGIDYVFQYDLALVFLGGGASLRELRCHSRTSEASEASTAQAQALAHYLLNQSQALPVRNGLLSYLEEDAYANINLPENQVALPFHAMMVAPLLLEGRALGYLCLASAKPGIYTWAELEHLQILAGLAGMAIGNALLYTELELYSELLEQAIESRTQALRRAKVRAEAILDHSPEPILLLKPDGRIDTANPAFFGMFGYGQDDLFRLSPGQLVDSAFTRRVNDAILRVIEQGETQRVDVVAVKHSGVLFDAELVIGPASNDEDLHGMVCVIRDISGLKEVQRLKDQFVSNVSHELRTPITSLKIYNRLLTANPAKQAEYQQKIERDLLRLEHTIEDLLRLSRFDQGRVEVNMANTDLVQVARQQVQDRLEMAHSKGLNIEFEDLGAPLVCLADEGLIGQVLSILLANALEYTPAPGRIKVTMRQHHNAYAAWVGFSVADTGPGIDAVEKEHIFQRFYRGSAGRHSTAPGTGLGLALAKEIVDLHTGIIQVSESELADTGACLTVYLPAAEVVQRAAG